jgi:single-stranded-DNA-specific exonuclease
VKYKWTLPPCPEAAVEALRYRGLDEVTARVCAARGYEDIGQVQADFGGGEALHDPFLLPDMDKAVRRIEQALRGGERIAVYGDYDVDGITATCLLTDCLRSRGGDVVTYIPSRDGEGYGLNTNALKRLREQGCSLVVTVDCGVTALSEAVFARELGLSLVVTDHHECRDSLPDCEAVVNPMRPDSQYPFPHLAGVGVAFKLCCALEGQPTPEWAARRAELAAIGTVADVMPLRGENRTLCKLGLKALERTRSPGLRALIRAGGIREKRLTASVLGYQLAPRINAAGRMGSAATAVELFLAKDDAEATLRAEELCRLNTLRQQAEQEIFAQALRQTDALRGDGGELPGALVLGGEGWPSGVVGIVASKLVERYKRPVFLISLEGELGKGSARSVPGLHLAQTLQECAPLLLNYGGHALAAGFTLERASVEAFHTRVEELTSAVFAAPLPAPELRLDAAVRPGMLTMASARALAMLEPYGAENPQPLLLLEGAELAQVQPIGGGRHLKLRLECEGTAFSAVCFGTDPESLGYAEGDVVDAAFALEINRFRDEESLQLQIRDLRLNESDRTREETEAALYRAFADGAPLSGEQRAALRPSRDEIAALWRYGKAGASGARPFLCRGAFRAAGLAPALHRGLVALDVLEEMGLLDTGCEDGVYCIKTRGVQGKVDLAASEILRKLTPPKESDAANS